MTLGFIYRVRVATGCVVVETRDVDGKHAIHNLPHSEWRKLLDSAGAVSDNEMIGQELIMRYELCVKACGGLL